MMGPLLLSLLLCLAAFAASEVTQVVFLGTGTPIPDPERQGPGVAIVVNNQPYIVDCGTGVVRQAVAALQKNYQERAVAHLTRAFVTHLHTDHTMGLPDLIFTPAVTGRHEALTIYGPPGLERMVRLIESAWSEDREIRLEGEERGDPVGYEVNVHEIEPGMIYQDENVKVHAFLVRHGAWEHAYGYRFETPDHVIVLSGDTTYCENLIESAKGCDLLIHEAYSAAGLDTLPAEDRQYHRDYHSSGGEVGRIATLVGPKLVLIYHGLFFGQPQGAIADEVKSVYDGPVIEAKDLESY